MYSTKPLLRSHSPPRPDDPRLRTRYPLVVCFVNGKAKRVKSEYVEGITYLQDVRSARQVQHFVQKHIAETLKFERGRLNEAGLVWAAMPPSEDALEAAQLAVAAWAVLNALVVFWSWVHLGAPHASWPIRGAAFRRPECGRAPSPSPSAKRRL